MRGRDVDVVDLSSFSIFESDDSTDSCCLKLLFVFGGVSDRLSMDCMGLLEDMAGESMPLLLPKLVLLLVLLSEGFVSIAFCKRSGKSMVRALMPKYLARLFGVPVPAPPVITGELAPPLPLVIVFGVNTFMSGGLPSAALSKFELLVEVLVGVAITLADATATFSAGTSLNLTLLTISILLF
jgi:hypothetical protein